MPDLNALYEALLNGDAENAVKTVKEALEENVEPQELLTKYMIPAMDEVGRLFEAKEYYLPELLISAQAMKNALELIRPLLAKSGVKPAGRVLIGTVRGDLHDIGKNIIISMLEGGGFEVIDLGIDVPPEKFASALQENNVDIVALSALLTTTMAAMRTTVEILKEKGLLENVKVIVGGAPVTQAFADEIGADGYSDNANGAVILARKLVE